MTAPTDELSRTHGIEVSMGSSFGAGRLWTNVGEIQLDLLKAAVEDHNGGGPNDRSRTLFHEHLDDQRHRPIEERLNTLVELCRIARELNGYVRTDAPTRRSWDLWLGIWATATSDAAANDALGVSLRAEVQRTQLDTLERDQIANGDDIDPELAEALAHGWLPRNAPSAGNRRARRLDRPLPAGLRRPLDRDPPPHRHRS